MYFTKEQRERYKAAAREFPAFGKNDMDLTESLKAYETLLEQIRAAMRDKIMALPDNPRIKRLGENAFTVKASDFAGAPWSPFYHDFKAQYKQIAEWIDTKTPSEVLVLIGQVVEKGSVWRPKGASLMFHPDVREYLKNLE